MFHFFFFFYSYFIFNVLNFSFTRKWREFLIILLLWETLYSFIIFLSFNIMYNIGILYAMKIHSSTYAKEISYTLARKFDTRAFPILIYFSAALLLKHIHSFYQTRLIYKYIRSFINYVRIYIFRTFRLL